MEDMIRRNRKYTSFWAVFLTITVLLVWDKLTGDKYVALLWPVFGLYMGGNALEHFSKKNVVVVQGDDHVDTD